MKDYILWIGGIYCESSMLKHLAVSPAANRWQAGLIGALEEQGLPVFVLSHLPEPIWPKGELRPGNPSDLDPRFESSLVRYWNFPFMRTISLRRNYFRSLRKICEQRGKPLAVFSYNPSPWGVAIGLYAQKNFDIPWIDVCADCYDPGPDWSGYAPGADAAKGHVFLSYQAFVSTPFSKKMHLDGGIGDLKFDSEASSAKKIILYTGMMSVWGGLSFLLKAFERISDPDLELWICGHGSNADLNVALKLDSRIRFFGLVSEERLQEIYHQASILVNPRPNNIDGNAMNFPSKILEYLSYGKPVVSTWTPGLSPEYRDVLEVLDEENEDCLAKTIEDVLRWSEDKRNTHSAKVKDFLLKNKTWEQQACKLLSYLKGDIL